MIWRTWLTEKLGGEYCFGEWESIFSVYNQRFGGWGQEEKRRYAVNSKQDLTKNLFLVGSFLTCWLAGPFCWYLLLSTNNFEPVACRKYWWGILFFGGECCFSLINQRYGRWGMVRGEEALCCQFSGNIVEQLLFSCILPELLTGWTIPPKSTLINQWFGECG